MLDDPQVNFAISDRARATGIDHLGIQVDERSCRNWPDASRRPAR
jgi:hypothetical protein